jgi:hypothetical protein
MTSPDEVVVTVRRQWNDWREARYRLSEVQGLHWDDVSGGVCASAPRSFVHGYVWCYGMIDGELAHSCRHGEGPHRSRFASSRRRMHPLGPKCLQQSARWVQVGSNGSNVAKVFPHDQPLSL